MRFVFDYMMFIYVLLIIVGFFMLLNKMIQPCNHQIPIFPIELIIGGAIGFALVTHSYYAVKHS